MENTIDATNKVRCSFCREEIEGEPVKKASKLYCCQACAFEDARRSQCGCSNCSPH